MCGYIFLLFYFIIIFTKWKSYTSESLDHFLTQNCVKYRFEPCILWNLLISNGFKDHDIYIHFTEFFVQEKNESLLARKHKRVSECETTYHCHRACTWRSVQSWCDPWTWAAWFPWGRPRDTRSGRRTRSAACSPSYSTPRQTPRCCGHPSL